jgi:TRAP-type C4-dicarboxylate transport system permease small subunit
MRQEGEGLKPSPLQKPPVSANAFKRASDKLMSALEQGSILGAVCLTLMMLLTVSDVAGRYFFNHPIQGTNEITGLLLVLVASSALAYSQIKKGHIRVDIISGRLSPRGQIILDAIAYFFCLFGSALITWQTFVRAGVYIVSRRPTETLSIPFFPFMLVLGLGFFFLAVVSLIDFLRSLAKVVRS